MQREINPKAGEIVLKRSFKEHYKELLGDKYEEFLRYSFIYPRQSIRVNTLKISTAELRKRLAPEWKLTPIPWCREGFWIEGKRRDIGNLPEHVLGYFYVQDASSMIPPIVMAPQPGDIVLDMAAAPGSKAGQIAQYMQNKGILVANDWKPDRIAVLGINLQRCGASNVVITQMNALAFRETPVFDKVLIDAPCSGTGTISKSLKTVLIWNPGMLRRLASTQAKLLRKAYMLAKPGGTIVYSTCSVEPEENELVVNSLLEEFPNAEVSPVNIKVHSSEPVLTYRDVPMHRQIANALRLYPQDNDTEGFFVAKILKP